MSKGRIIGGCGGFPESDAREAGKEESGCCHGGCGCGFGKAQEGSVQDASGKGDLSQENKEEENIYCLIELDSGSRIIVHKDQLKLGTQHNHSMLHRLFFGREHVQNYVIVMGREVGEEEAEREYVIFLDHISRIFRVISSEPKEPVGCATMEKKRSGSAEPFDGGC